MQATHRREGGALVTFYVVDDSGFWTASDWPQAIKKSKHRMYILEELSCERLIARDFLRRDAADCIVREPTNVFPMIHEA